MCVQESLRLHTVAAGGTIRTLGKPLQLGKHHLPAGTTVQVAFHGIHRNPAVWDRPDDFLPVMPSHFSDAIVSCILAVDRTCQQEFHRLEPRSVPSKDAHGALASLKTPSVYALSGAVAPMHT